MQSSEPSSPTPPWLRILQIVLGGLCITLSLFILVYIGPAISTIILILSVILLAVGIERMVVGLAMRHHHRGSGLSNIVIGLTVIAFSIVLMQFPIFTSSVLVVLAAIALLLNGIARIVHGASGKGSVSSRTLLVGVGTLSSALSILVIARPFDLGLVLLALMISVAFLISGAEMMILGISGRQRYATRNTAE